MEEKESPLVTLRPAIQGDGDFLFSLWDDETRRTSFSGGPTDLDGHRAWLTRRLTEPCLFVATERGLPVGMARLDVRGHEAEVSVSVGPSHRRRGLGPAILQALEDEARALPLALHTLTAQIKEGNAGARAAFAHAGYRITKQHDGIVTMGLAL